MKIFLYNEHAIKNTPAKPRADTVTIPMRGWHRRAAPTEQGEEQRGTPEPPLALRSGLGREAGRVPPFNLEKSINFQFLFSDVFIIRLNLLSWMGFVLLVPSFLLPSSWWDAFVPS